MESFKFDISAYEDVSPLAIDLESENELCRIMYTEEYKQLMGICRAMLMKNELSIRGLNLTSKLILLAPAFYTVWNYRFNIISHLVSEENNLYPNSKEESEYLLNKELDWLDEITLNNPKNYQIWSYRQSVLSILHPKPTLKRELPILQLMIDDDTKNYHVWSYRKWCCKFFNDFSNELVFTNGFIKRDVYNNSAWNHRMFMFKTMGVLNENDSRAELEFVMDKITFVPQNVSTWNYLRGFLEFFKLLENKEIAKEIYEFTAGFIDTGSLADIKDPLPEIQSSYALEFFAFLNRNDNKTVSINAYKSLAMKYDPIRKNLWDHKIKLLEA